MIDMAECEEEIIVCYSCGALMNVATLAPYSRVICPTCQVENRVKKQFGPYVLNRRHAIGGMSSVFIATDGTLDREVALKILSEEFSSDVKRITAFEEEARLTASFSHPNVVRVFTTGKAFGRFYIAMEFVPGGHFEHQIRERGRIPEKEILPLAIQVAEGLKGAQSAGLIHRDVKPGNILLDSEGNAKIVDFGLALVTQGGKAKAEEIWATPYYVPPEAIEGGVEDFRADIYAFGATFYHALSGKPPCDEESMSTDVLREAKRHIIPLGRAAPDLLEETCAVIDRAMAYDPSNRFASYDEMISGLHTALKVASGEAVSGGAGTKALRRLELRRRKQRKVALAAAAALSLAAVGGVFVWKATAGSGNPKPKPVTVAIGSDVGTDTAHRIAARYRSARKAMERGEFRDAETSFSALLQDHAVQEPTRTWAGLEALVAAMMDGRMNDARKHAASARNHIKETPAGIASGFQTGVLPVLNEFEEPGFFDHKALNLGSQGSERHMGHLIAGLKNWEQGGFDQGLAILKDFASEPSLSDDGVLAWYQKTAKAYLHDYDKLKSGALDLEPGTPAACKETIEELNRLLTTLETKSRASFNIRARQLDLTKLESVLSNPQSQDKKVGLEGGSKLLADIEFFSKGYRFAEIVAKLTEFKGDPPGCKRASLLVVSQSARVFLSEIEADLVKGAVNLPLTLRDGTEIASVVVSESRLYSKRKEGEIREIRWMDLPPDQVIKLHGELLKRLPKETDRTRRDELAIAFQWLVGQRERAITAAENLAGKNATFKQHWEALSPGLPK